MLPNPLNLIKKIRYRRTRSLDKEHSDTKFGKVRGQIHADECGNHIESDQKARSDSLSECSNAAHYPKKKLSVSSNSSVEPRIFKMCKLNASSPSNSASIGSSEYPYGYRNSSKDQRDHDLLDPIEPLDHHQHYSSNHHSHHHHHHHHHHHRDGSVKRGQFTRSLSNTDPPPDERTDGSLSDTAVGRFKG
nr:unnamed protein product [Callosobruchus chinensis]